MFIENPIIIFQRTITQEEGVQPVFCITSEEFTYDYTPRKYSVWIFHSQTRK